MITDRPPEGTITGAEGELEVAPEATFVPTSAIGDGTLHVHGQLAGFIYAAVRYPSLGKKPSWKFTTLDAQHRELESFPTQREAIDRLLVGS